MVDATFRIRLSLGVGLIIDGKGIESATPPAANNALGREMPMRFPAGSSVRKRRVKRRLMVPRKVVPS
jgi:hypothetical protein